MATDVLMAWNIWKCELMLQEEALITGTTESLLKTGTAVRVHFAQPQYWGSKV